MKFEFEGTIHKDYTRSGKDALPPRPTGIYQLNPKDFKGKKIFDGMRILNDFDGIQDLKFTDNTKRKVKITVEILDD